MPRNGYIGLTVNDQLNAPLRAYSKDQNRKSISNAAETLLLEILTQKGYIKEGGRKN